MFTLKYLIEASPKVIFNAWLNSEEHSNMTGGMAICSNKVGDVFSAWDEYISGENIEIIQNEKIVQSWRTTEFLEDDPDSKLTLTFTAKGEGCELTLIHENISSGQSDYEKGWQEHYFEPMKLYFEGK